MIRPQAGAAAGRVKGVGLEPSTIIVGSRGRHVEPSETALSTVSVTGSGPAPWD